MNSNPFFNNELLRTEKNNTSEAELWRKHFQFKIVSDELDDTPDPPL